jgi:hypothetical protein
MRFLLSAFMFVSMTLSAAEVKQAEYYDFGKGATVTFIAKKADGKVDLRVKNPATGEVTPNTFTKKVLWITKAVRKSVPVAQGGDGIEEEVYIYQFEDGAVWHTVAAQWKDPVVVRPVEASPTAVVDSEGNVLSKLIPNSRCGDVVGIEGEILPTPPKMRVEVFCRCNGEIKSRKWVQVMMDGKEHYWPDDK